MTHETHECVCVCNDEQVRITGTTVEWDEMRFDVRLLQRVPYEGISRMQTSLCAEALLKHMLTPEQTQAHSRTNALRHSSLTLALCSQAPPSPRSRGSSWHRHDDR